MNSKKSKLRTNQNLSLKTPALSSRNHRARSNSSGKNVDNTALYSVSRNLSTKRLSLLIKESNRTLESLQKSEEQLQLFNQQLFFIIQSTCSVIDNDLFSSLAKSLASVFGVRYVIIGKITGTTSEQVKTMAFWDGSKTAENFVYDLKGTPCKKMVDMDISYFPHTVQEHFSTIYF